MGDIVPEALNYRHVFMDTAAGDPLTVAKKKMYRSMRHLTFYFADADNAELFPTPPGCVAVAWQPSGVSHLGSMTIGASGIVFTGSANGLGWLHCLCNGTLKTGTTTTEAPVAQGTAGHTRPQSTMFLSHRSASPATITSGRHVNKLGLKFRVFEFAPPADDDVWLCESAGLCPGIVAVAWQANTATDNVNVTQRANGDVVFNSSTSAEYGWLWTWSR